MMHVSGAGITSSAIFGFIASSSIWGATLESTRGAVWTGTWNTFWGVFCDEGGTSASDADWNTAWGFLLIGAGGTAFEGVTDGTIDETEIAALWRLWGSVFGGVIRIFGIFGIVGISGIFGIWSFTYVVCSFETDIFLNLILILLTYYLEQILDLKHDCLNLNVHNPYIKNIMLN